jgi:hypothetical protein
MMSPKPKHRKPNKQYSTSYDWASELQNTESYYAWCYRQSPGTGLFLDRCRAFNVVSTTRAVFVLFSQGLGAFWTYFKSHRVLPPSLAIELEITSEKVANLMPFHMGGEYGLSNNP